MIMEWMLLPLRRYAEFSGRSRRKEYWMFTLGMVLLGILMSVLLFAIGGTALLNAGSDPAGMVGAMMGLGAVFILFLVIGLALLIPSLAVSVRRLHDTNRSGWWLAGFYGLAFLSGVVAESSSSLALIANLAYFAAALILLVFMVLPGTKGPNRYGEDPK